MKGIRKGYVNGSVLIIVLILLLSVSMLGVSTIKNGIFQQRMIRNAQVDASVLQAAESAINSVLIKTQQTKGNQDFLKKTLLEGSQMNCWNGAPIDAHVSHCRVLASTNTSGGEMQEANQIQAYSITEKKGVLPVSGYDVSLFVFHVFDSTGVAKIGEDGSRYAYANTQRWGHFGVSSEFDTLKPE